MRIVIDLQGCQSESRHRGIGRYTRAFVQAVLRNRENHEVILALSGLFPETIMDLRDEFKDLIAQDRIRVWHAVGPVRASQSANDHRRFSASVLREAFLCSLRPDVIHISSLFEGYLDDAVTSVGLLDTRTPVTASLYDLIPLLNPDHFFKGNPAYEEFYSQKLSDLEKTTALLAISEHSKREALSCLNVSNTSVEVVSAAIDPAFCQQNVDVCSASDLRRRVGLTRKFVLYTGGSDKHKNLARLVEAWARLAVHYRQAYQLLIVGRMPAAAHAQLSALAFQKGLAPDELIVYGQVTDDELLKLYNLCDLFVFPSWHEGFGLPPLEAMACGAPTISSRAASLPEVVGLDEAMFDPFSVDSISDKISQGLSDEEFRHRLRDHGLRQSPKFSWDETARRALRVWESIHSGMTVKQSSHASRASCYGRGFFQKLQPALGNLGNSSWVALSSCVACNQQAGSERQLLLDVSELCQRDAATGVQRVVRCYLEQALKSPPAGFRIEPVYADRNSQYHYARSFTRKLLGLPLEGAEDEEINWQRGDIFFGLDMQHHVQLAHADFYQILRAEGVTVKFLVHDLLPIQLPECFNAPDAKELHECWLTMIARTDGAICVSRATEQALNEWLSNNHIKKASNFSTSWVHNGADFRPAGLRLDLAPDEAATLAKIGERYTFLAVGTLEPRKGQQQILDAFDLLWTEGFDFNLVLVGNKGWKTDDLEKRIRNHREQGVRLFRLAGVSDSFLQQLYAASHCLIAASKNEGFGLPVAEAAFHGKSVIARDIPVFREIANDGAFYFSGNEPSDLAQAVKVWTELRESKNLPHPSSKMPSWEESAGKLFSEITLKNYPRKQLLVDVSELVKRDVGTGIQRVVGALLKSLLENPPDGYRVEPVYADHDHGYLYARGFTHRFTGSFQANLPDDPIDYAPDDIFLGLDLHPQVVVKHRDLYQKLRRQGVRVSFVVYDLLCVLQPQHFPPGAEQGFRQWLNVVAEADQALCISRSVAAELSEWLQNNSSTGSHLPAIDWFHLGADFEKTAKTTGLPQNASEILEKLSHRPSFLMVGTIEPRKGHAQVLDAFDTLWRSGLDVNLVLVGKKGWMVDDLAKNIQKHREFGNRLFWLPNSSDEFLEKLYANSSCLLAASYGEGFGLPLIEAARYKRPILARNIPVFKEVAGVHAHYFNAETPAALASAVGEWLMLSAQKSHPTPDGLRWLKWSDSAKSLLNKLQAPNERHV